MNETKKDYGFLTPPDQKKITKMFMFDGDLSTVNVALDGNTYPGQKLKKHWCKEIIEISMKQTCHIVPFKGSG